jgi:hypothetical protein
MDSTSEPALSNESPKRTWRASAADKLSRKWWFLDARDLCGRARRRTRLEDFGEPALEPALPLLVGSLETEADLRPLGRFLMHVHLQGLLETRLRLTELWRKQGDSLNSIPIQRPIFITGMPRSGSTFLHELLAEDPDNRAPRVWEVMFPVPRPARTEPDPRIKQAAACLWWFRRFAPQADAVFPLRACTPHECVAIQSYSLLSEEFVSTCRIPTYESFLRQADLRPAYAWERRFLQHLQGRAPARRWVLKSPDHAYGLGALFNLFPDALVIQTHRSPFEVLKSSCHLTEVLHGLYAHPTSPERLAARETRVLAGALNRFINFRDDHPELSNRFVDVRYHDIISDPLAVIRRIYHAFGMTLTSQAVEQMRELADRRTRYGNGRARTAPVDSKLPAIADASSFNRYCARYHVGWHQSQAR